MNQLTQEVIVENYIWGQFGQDIDPNDFSSQSLNLTESKISQSQSNSMIIQKMPTSMPKSFPPSREMSFMEKD